MNTSASIDHAAEALVARKRGLRPNHPRPRLQGGGERSELASKDITLEHVLVAARRREAPVSVETAGYIALAVADAKAAAPAVLGTANVRLSAEGLVSVVGAAGYGTDADAERCVRALLGRLLAVAVGSSPALVTCAKRPAGRGVAVLVREIEAALIPANRSAARRSIARLARETARAAPDITGTTKPLVSQASAPAERPRKERPRTPVPALLDVPPPKVLAPEPIEPAFQDALSEAQAAHVTDNTDVDGALVEHVEPYPAPRDDTPQLATYDPHPRITEPPTEVADDPAPIVASFDEDDDADLLTYIPPEVADGDDMLDFGTASPPAVADAASDEAEQAGEDASPEPSAPAPGVAAAVVPSTPAAHVNASRADSHRVDELLATFGTTTARSARDVAGDLKALVGLPPTPPPPPVEPDGPGADEPTARSDSRPSDQPPAKARIEYARPRNPKLALAVSVVLLVVAILGIGAVYFAFPQLLIGH